MSCFDVHVATQGFPDSGLETELIRRGFQSDPLIDNHVTFGTRHETSTCPLIGLHMTKKDYPSEFLAAKKQISSDMDFIAQSLEAYGENAYAHAEFTHPWAVILPR
jgi:hypothetical protein